MNREHIKTVVLIFLVITSVFLTSRLWIADYQYEQAEGNNVEDLTYSDQPELYEQLKPESIVLTILETVEGHEQNDNEQQNSLQGLEFLEGNRTELEELFLLRENHVAYELAWDLLSERIKERELILDSVINDKEELELEENFLVYEFAKVSPVELMLEEEYGLTHYYEEGFNNILLTLTEENPEVYLVDDDIDLGYPVNLSISQMEMAELKAKIQDKELDSGTLVQSNQLADLFLEVGTEFIDYDSFINDSEINELNYDDQIVEQEHSEELITIMDDIEDFHHYLAEEIIEQDQKFLLPESLDNRYGPKRVKYEDQDRERLAQAFFLDLSFVRQIEERDGTSIFTDGQRGLRFYPDGGLQYNAPQRDDDAGVLDATILLERGGQLISLYGGWHDKLRVTSLDTGDNTRNLNEPIISELEYRYYHRGIPVVGEPPLTLALSNNKLVEYFRKVPTEIEQIQENGEAIDATEALRIWMEKEYRQLVEDLPEQASEILEEEGELREGLQRVYNKVTNIQSINLEYRQTRCQNDNYYIVPVWKVTFEQDEEVILLAWDFEEEQITDELLRDKDWL